MRQPMRPRVHRWAWITVAACGVLGVLGAGGMERPALGAEVRLQNGVVIEGTPVPIEGLKRHEILRKGALANRFHPILLVDAGMKRYFVPNRQVADIDHAAGVTRNEETFELHPNRPASRKVFGRLGGVRVLDDFDEHGRRLVEVGTPDGPIKIVQAVTRLNPRYLTVRAVNEVDWEHGIATTSLRREQLAPLLRKAIDPNNPQQRMGVAVFYMQAGLYDRAKAELESIIGEFPEMEARVREVRELLRDVEADRLLAELRMRREAGQHELTGLVLDQFADDLGAAVQKQVAEQRAALTRRFEQYDLVLNRVATLQQQLGGEFESDRPALDAMRSALRAELDFEGLPRLDAFLKFEDDTTLAPAEKLALAYSGWVLGSAGAVTELEQTINLWTARHLVIQAVRTFEVNEQRELVAKLEELEGVTAETVAQMIPHLPAVRETPGARTGVPLSFTVPDTRPGTEVKYHVLLPHEYSPNHAYPVIIALHPQGGGPAWSLTWWGGSPQRPGQAQRHGYIVIAPEYAPEGESSYGYGEEAKQVVLATLRDAGHRFHLDRDRVFLSGHGMGGDAAFDVGMTRPDLFAGVIPISGRCAGACRQKLENGERTAWYVVNGELSDASLQDEDHADNILRMMKRGVKFDLIAVEYIGQGTDTFYDEIHRLFDWMALHRRRDEPKEFEATVVDDSDPRLYWLQPDGLPRPALNRPVTFDGQLTEGGDRATITIGSGAPVHTVWLAPRLLNYDRRLQVRVNGDRKFFDFPENSIADLLEDFRTRADRQRLYHTKIVAE